MPDGGIAERSFSLDDQLAFASLSGDFNPIHVDPIAARRTAAGAAVVHGVHALLWALDSIARDDRAAGRVASLCAIDADFAQFLRVGERASLVVTRRSDTVCRTELRVEGERVAQYALKFGGMAEPVPVAFARSGIAYAAERQDPLPLSAEEVREASGEVWCAGSDAAAARFPDLAAWIGPARVTSLLAATRLVGMVSPGLHSTFHRLSVSLVDRDRFPGRLVFATRPGDPRFAIVTLDIEAAGIAGTLKASRRQPPTSQPSCAALGPLVADQDHTGHHALVVGGSRGLGEVAAKLLAGAGASVSLTYRSGEADARRVVEEIREAGGAAACLRYDCMERADPQLSALPTPPSSVYYFATTQILTRTAPGFSAARLALFTRVYVEGFADLLEALAARTGTNALVAFYPSSVFVDEVPTNMAEYAMAKAAGEVLCRHLDRSSGRVAVDVERLPRMATDQTAGMIEQEMAEAGELMARVIARVEGRAAARAGMNVAP